MTREHRERTLAVIAARGGSKGIPHKNLIDLCGKPLIAWTVMQAAAARGVDVVAVSSDSDEILAAAEAAGAVGVRRPDDISGDLASSEVGLAARAGAARWQARPVRAYRRACRRPRRSARPAISTRRSKLSSGRSSTACSRSARSRIISTGASAPTARNRSTTTTTTGACASRSKSAISRTARSTFSFRRLLREQNNRLGGKIGMHVMERHKMFQIDRPEDIKLCAAIMRSYGYA